MIVRLLLSTVSYLFLVIPLSIYSTNSYYLTIAENLFFLGVFFAFFVLSCCVILIFRTTFSRLRFDYVKVSILAVISFTLFLFGSFSSASVDGLSGLKIDQLTPSPKFDGDIWVSVIILSFATLLLFLRNGKFKFSFLNNLSIIAVTFSGALLLTTFYQAAVVTSKDELLSFFQKDSAVQEVAIQSTTPDSPNIYHFVLDAFGAPGFLEALDSSPSPKLLNDFYFYSDNRSSFDHTSPSIASMKMGRLPKEGESFGQFIESSRREGIDKFLATAGFRISNYNENANWIHESANYSFTNDDAIQDFRKLSSRVYLLFDFWFLRLLPNAIHPIYYKDGRGPFTSFLSNKFAGVDFVPLPLGENERTVASMLLMKQLIEDEASRKSVGEYVYMHSYITHGPYVLDADCQWTSSEIHPDFLVERPLSDDVATPDDYFVPQAACALNLLQQFVSELKRLDRYDSSLIIVHADHGTWEVGSPNMKVMDGSAQVLVDNPRGVPPEYVINQSNALLLVKYPNVQQSELVNSDQRTSLLDIFPAILNYINSLEMDSSPAFILLSQNKESERIFIMGYKQIINEETRETRTLSPDFPNTTLTHYSINTEGDFTILKHVPVRW
jgi:hypothetical protein